MLGSIETAQLIDVRTTAEWAYVGIPLLQDIGKNPVLVEWQFFPSMTVNPDFVKSVGEQLDVLGIGRDAPLLFLCRSGVRSKHAAIAMTAAGYSRAYNVTEGFEGIPDNDRHRGRVNGWKYEDLPWIQG